MTSKYNEGIRLFKDGLYADALHCFLREAESPDNDIFKIDIAYYIGLCYAKLRQYDDALLYIEQVVTSGAEQRRIEQCRMILVFIYITTKRFRLADFELHKLMDAGVKTVQVMCSLGYIAYEQNRLEDAADHYESALLIDENNATALNCLGFILCVQSRELPRALRMCKQALDVSPENPAYLDSLGWVYYTLGMAKESLSYLTKAAELRPDDEIIKKHLAAVQLIA